MSNTENTDGIGDEFLSLFRLGSKKYFDSYYLEQKRRQNRPPKLADQPPKPPRLIEEYIIHLRSLRLVAGISQQTLAGKMKTTQSVISRFEQGCSSPTISFLNRYAKAVRAEVVLAIRRPPGLKTDSADKPGSSRDHKPS